MVRTRPRSAAWKEALIEGKFLRKTGFVINRNIKRIIAGMDKRIGNIARNVVYSHTEVDPRKVMFITFQGEYTCNQKYITEELLRRGFDGTIVWSLKGSAIRQIEEGVMEFPENIVYVEQFTEEFFNQLSSSRVWVANSVDFLKRRVPKKKEQYFIETWHGSLGLKRFDASVNKGKAWVEAAKLCGDYADALISNSTFENNIYRNSFWQTTPIIECGHPRNDVFFQDHDMMKLKKKIAERYGFDTSCKIALYAPTFRDDHQFKCYCLRQQALESALSDRWGGDWILLAKYHPTVSKYVAKRSNHSLGINVTDYPDIQELMMIADIGITDYSSWIYDYMLSGKPCFIFAADLQHYCEKERGFCYPIESTPFPIATSNNEMIKAVLNFDEESYATRLKLFLEDKGCIENGTASAAVADLIEEMTRLT